MHHKTADKYYIYFHHTCQAESTHFREIYKPGQLRACACQPYLGDSNSMYVIGPVSVTFTKFRPSNVIIGSAPTKFSTMCIKCKITTPI